jgi:hypothetical protein
MTEELFDYWHTSWLEYKRNPCRRTSIAYESMASLMSVAGDYDISKVESWFEYTRYCADHSCS